MQSNWLNYSGQMQASNWLYELEGAPAKLAHPTQDIPPLGQMTADLHCLKV